MKRALIRRLITVHIDPQGSGRSFDPAKVRINYRSDRAAAQEAA
ncbi:hypothetical protein [Cellulomonas fengjieae]|nr:hypothetical protein [Cellulomonas fengjieae]